MPSAKAESSSAATGRFDALREDCDEEKEEPDTEMTAKERLALEAKSTEHLATHEPFNPECDVCVQAQKTRRQKRSRKNRKPAVQEAAKPEHFGDHVTGDQFNLRRDGKNGGEKPDEFFPDASVAQCTTAVVLYDYGTDWYACYPRQPSQLSIALKP